MDPIPALHFALAAHALGLVNRADLLDAVCAWFDDLDLAIVVGPGGVRTPEERWRSAGRLDDEAAATAREAMQGVPPATEESLRRELLDMHPPAALLQWLAIVSREGYDPVRCPLLVSRCEHLELDLTLWRPGELPEGLIPVPAGHFDCGGDAENPYSGPAARQELDDFALSCLPVTCREYCEFLNDLARSDPGGAVKRTPRNSEEAGFYWPSGPFEVPTEEWFAAATPAKRATAHRLTNAPVDWEEDWPVMGVSWEDAIAFAAWRSAREGRLYTLPHSLQWEKAARGHDRRFLPWGRHMIDPWANTNMSQPLGMRPASVSAFPSDESPYGIRGLAANSSDYCLDDAGEIYPGWRNSRGGSWAFNMMHARSACRSAYKPRFIDNWVGIRLALLPRLAVSSAAALPASR
ncbi:MAG: SUMF1/EgtB/PvdO family nonheme iron enzyme [Planctomycetes bacterium]|nr:SUMF1/EgtB/PvdO family nonheme iron enzyme [Planctomycetota bacterium]